MSTQCEKEFNLRNFGFHHKRPTIFVTPQVGPQALYPVWTVIHVLYHIIALGVDGYQASVASGEPSGSYFMYLHNWTYMLLVLSSIVDCVVTLYVHCLAKYILEERESKKAEAEIVMRNKAVKLSYKTMGKYYTMRWYLQLTWAFFTISSVTGITMTFIYWLLNFLSVGIKLDYSLNGARLEEKTVDFGTLAFNFINTIVILINLMITAKPFRLLHFYMPMIFFLIYMIFSVLYQTFNNEYIYRILDWNQVFFTCGITHGVVFIIVPLMHALVYGLVQLRIKLGTWLLIRYSFNKWKKKKIVPIEPEVDRETNEMRWTESTTVRTVSAGIGSNLNDAFERSHSVYSDRRGSLASTTISVKSETSL